MFGVGFGGFKVLHRRGGSLSALRYILDIKTIALRRQKVSKIRGTDRPLRASTCGFRQVGGQEGVLRHCRGNVLRRCQV